MSKNNNARWDNLKKFVHGQLTAYRKVCHEEIDQFSFMTLLPEYKAKVKVQLAEAQQMLEPYLGEIIKADKWLADQSIRWIDRDDGVLECIFFGICRLVKKPNQVLFDVYTKTLKSLYDNDATWVKVDPCNQKPHEFLLLEHISLHDWLMVDSEISKSLINLKQRDNTNIFRLLIILQAFGLYHEVGRRKFLEKIYGLRVITDLIGDGRSGGVGTGEEKQDLISEVSSLLAQCHKDKTLELFTSKIIKIEESISSAFKCFIDATAYKYFLKQNTYFSLQSYFDYVRKHEKHFNDYEYWEADNPNKVTLLIANKCNQQQLKDKNLFAYSNILNDESPVGCFETKAQFRKLMQIPNGCLSGYLELKSNLQESKKDIQFAKNHFKIFIRWVEGSRLNFSELEESQESFNFAIEVIERLIPVAQEVSPDRINYALDLLIHAGKGLHVAQGGWFAERAALSFTKTNEIVDFIISKNALGTDYNINRLSSKTTIKSVRNMIAAWHKDLQTVDLQKLKMDKSSHIQYEHPTLKRYKVDGIVFEPICSNVELMEHGILMDNCLYSYDENIQGGIYSIFKMSYKGKNYAACYEILSTICLEECNGYKNEGVPDKVLEAASKLAKMMQEAQERGSIQKRAG